MTTIKIHFLFLFLIILTVSPHAQDNLNTPQRTPEQEATKQTEKLQQELNLSFDQAKQVYEINLKYARERQISNTRTQAMERMKNKNAEIEQVLKPDQNSKLQSMRYDRSTIQNNGQNQIPANSSGFRSNQDNNKPTLRMPAPTDMNLRSTYRSVRPDNNPTAQPNNNVQRNSTASPRVTQPVTIQQSTRTQTTTPSQNPTVNRRSETPTSTQTNRK
jgi:Na+-transporting methylmalonyl-CoA/oxaloacetate decarboxylase gamma subunit